MPTPSNSINEATTGIAGFTGTSFTGSPATQHCVQIGGATTSTLVSVTNGTNGQVLTANTGAAPTFQTPSAGSGLVLLTSFDLTGLSEQAFTSLISSTYRNYLLKIVNLSSSAGTRAGMVISSDNGSTYYNSTYAFFYGDMYTGGGFSSVGGGGQPNFFITNNLGDAATQPQANVNIDFYSGLGGSCFTYHGMSLRYDSVSGIAYELPWGYYENLSPSPVNAIKLITESGTFGSGFASLYGYTK